MSAYACAPGWSSEPGIGWGVASAVAAHHDVWVLTSEQYRAPFEDPANAVPPRLTVEFVPAPAPSRAGAYPAYLAWQLAAYRRAQQLHRQISFDLAHHVTFANSAMPSLLGRLGIPFVWYAGSFSATPARFLPGIGLRAGMAETARDLVAATAGRVSRRLTTTPRTTIVSVDAPPRPSTTRWRPLVLGGLHSWELSALLSLPPRPEDDGVFRILSVGRLLGWKGFHLGMRAFARFQASVPQSEYLVVGHGEQRRRLEALAHALGVGDRVRFAGSCTRAETFAALASSDVVLHPSLHEQVGFAVLEAMAAGRPVVCLDAAGPPRLVGDTGVVVARRAPGQVVEDLAAALVRLHADVAWRRALGEAARTRAAEHWSWARVADDLLDVYRSCVAG